jgi:hypothetical protein
MNIKNYQQIYWSKYYLKHHNILLKKYKEYYEKNRKKFLEYSENYYKNHKETIKHYNQINKKKISLRHKKYYDLNKEKIKKYHKQYQKERKEKDINYKILCNIRNRVYLVIKGLRKSISTLKLLGCSINILRQHLELQFKSGMNWSNYGEWHIDHIRPCASFDLSKKSEQYKCFNYKNLQPLWAKENVIKRDKFIGEKILFPTKNSIKVKVNSRRKCLLSPY